MSIQKVYTKHYPAADTASLNLIQKFNAFADSQEKLSMIWWLASLFVIGGFFLPVTFLLVYSLDGLTTPFLIFSMISFFACIVANMGGMGIRASISTFIFSIIIHLIMIACTLIAFL